MYDASPARFDYSMFFLKIKGRKEDMVRVDVETNGSNDRIDTLTFAE